MMDRALGKPRRHLLDEQVSLPREATHDVVSMVNRLMVGLLVDAKAKAQSQGVAAWSRPLAPSSGGPP